MDPFTIALAFSFFGAVAVATVAITFRRIYDWFRARGQIKTENSSAIAFTLAERMNNRKYAEVHGVFGNRPSNTRIIQGFYDPYQNRIIQARGLASSTPPADQAVIRRHDEGDGLVIYT